MKAFMTILVTELKLASRNFNYMFFAFVFPPMLLLLFGSIYGNEPAEFYGGFGAVDILTPCYMAMILAVSGIMGLPLQMAEYRQHKVLKRFRATPIGTWTIMGPHLVVNGVLCIAGMLALVIVGKLVFNLQFMGNHLLFMGAMLLCIVAIFSLGFLIAAIAPNNRSATLTANMLYFPMLFLSGASLPMEMMPDAIVTVSKVIPLTYCVELLKGLWLGGQIGDYWVPAVVLIGISLVCTGISIKVFRWE